MREFFSKLYPDLQYKKGDVFVVKIIPLKNVSGFLLASKSKNTPKSKPRPIVIYENKGETVKFFALSSDEDLKEKRPEFNMSGCKIEKKPNECFGINFKKKTNLVFAKKTKTKMRVYYEIDIHKLNLLEEEGNLKHCGKCEKNTINKTVNYIQKYFDGGVI